MSSLLIRGHVLLKNVKGAIVPAYVRLAHNYDDYKPGPKPKTKAEVEAAARKYGLLPEEYEVYDDKDGLGHGDYPKLPDVAIEVRNPYYPWDFPEHKRNYGEPWHQQFDLISEDRYNISLKPPASKLNMILTFSGVIGLFTIAFVFLENYKYFHPVMEKQYPQAGIAHFTFEKTE